LSKLINTKPELVNCVSSTQSHCLTLFIPPSLDYFKGHFSQGPILAGVVQLDWAVDAARKYFNVKREVKDIEVLKFQVVITPGLTIKLTVEEKPGGRYGFSYQSDKGQHASGRIVFKSDTDE
jgi:3-hydroxymyristoyl/3-hydroxydecanoyl-(acyl carrier protein) dehydratase